MNSVGSAVYGIATWLVPLAIAIVFHEIAHGRVAKLFGDNTASDAGRLSFNPLKHVDPIGTVILPMALALTNAPIFGWAKPVPVDSARLRNPRWHMVLVAAAGPASNILLALLTAVALGLMARFLPQVGGETVMLFVVKNLLNFAAINVFLALFNMIPIPPFDGSKVLAGFLPDGIRQSFQRLDRFALLFMIGFIVVIPQIFPRANLISRFVNPPANWLFTQFDGIVSFVAGG